MTPIPKTPAEVLKDFNGLSTHYGKVMCSHDNPVLSKADVAQFLRSSLISLLLEAKGRMPKDVSRFAPASSRSAYYAALSDANAVIDAMIAEVKGESV